MLEEVLAFWFKEIDQEQWRIFDPTFDALLEKRFLVSLQQASAGDFFAWREKARGRLAEVVVWDQFSRNIQRGTPLAFAQDPMALALAQEAVSAGAMSELNAEECSFLLMPYMHSGSRDTSVQAEILFKQHAPSRYEIFLRVEHWHADSNECRRIAQAIGRTRRTRACNCRNDIDSSDAIGLARTIHECHAPSLVP